MVAVALNDVWGMLCMVGSELFLAAVNTIVRSVKGWSPQRIMVTRFLVDLTMCAILCTILRYETPKFKHIIRCVARGVTFCTYLTLFWLQLQSCLPMGDGVVILLACAPIMTTILCKLVLGEAIPPYWFLQTAFCTAGAVLVNKPGVPREDCPAWTALLPVGAAICGGFTNLLSRELKAVPSPMLMLFTDAVAAVYATTYVAFREQASPFPQEIDNSLKLVLLAGLIGWFGLQLNVKGNQTVSVAAVASIAGYSGVPINYTFQVVVFGNMPDLFSVVGALLVMGTNIAAVYLRYKAANKARTATNSEFSVTDETCALSVLEFPCESIYRRQTS